jgi:hypothetical protein
MKHSITGVLVVEVGGIGDMCSHEGTWGFHCLPLHRIDEGNRVHLGHQLDVQEHSRRDWGHTVTLKMLLKGVGGRYWGGRKVCWNRRTGAHLSHVSVGFLEGRAWLNLPHGTDERYRELGSGGSRCQGG